MKLDANPPPAVTILRMGSARCSLLLGLAAVLLAPQAFPQSQNPPPPPGIQDNSFLIEEAYNQEEGVVQHISNFTYLWPGRGWAYSFTQEWPLGRYPKHQFSYTIPVVDPGSSTRTGVGDVALNYRYQLVGNGSAKVAFAPRVSVLLPTGDFRRELGLGSTGVQINLPLSVVISPKLVTHWNAGTTITPHARNAAGHRATAVGYNLGQSFIWRFRPRFNGMLETVWVDAERVVGTGRTARERALILNPGIRWAYNFRNGLQIVPGISTPIGFGPGRQRGILLYLSFEHPFTKRRN